MAKCWLFEETGEVRKPERGEWFWYPRSRGEGIKEKLESIICLAVEGPECESHAKLFEAIIREASKALNILEAK
jgi:hypothetical protein